MTKDTSNPIDAFQAIPMREWLCGQIGDISSGTATTSSCYLRVPFRAKFIKAWVTTYGVTSSADAVITIAINGTNLTNFSTITVTQSDNAAGNSYTTTSAINSAGDIFVNSGDVISFISNHGSSTACPATAMVEIRMGS